MNCLKRIYLEYFAQSFFKEEEMSMLVFVLFLESTVLGKELFSKFYHNFFLQNYQQTLFH